MVLTSAPAHMMLTPGCDGRVRVHDVSGSNSVLRYLPNTISMARLASTPLLVWLAWTSRETAFAWLLVAALVSDAVDGMLARAFGWASSIGSLFDSVADATLMLSAAYGVWVFHSYVFADYGIIVWGVLALWAVEHLAALVRSTITVAGAT